MGFHQGHRPSEGIWFVYRKKGCVIKHLPFSSAGEVHTVFLSVILWLKKEPEQKNARVWEIINFIS